MFIETRDIVIQPMVRADIGRGFLNSLAALSKNGTDILEGLDPVAANCIFSKLYRRPEYRFLVAKTGEAVVGTATVLFEQKFIHGGGVVAHVEDVAVAAECQRNGVGKRLLAGAVKAARDRCCYKVTLACSEKNVAFYEDCGFRQNGEVVMRIDL